MSESKPCNPCDYHRRCAEMLRYVAAHAHTDDEAAAATFGAEHHEQEIRRLAEFVPSNMIAEMPDGNWLVLPGITA